MRWIKIQENMKFNLKKSITESVRVDATNRGALVETSHEPAWTRPPAIVRCACTVAIQRKSLFDTQRHKDPEVAG